MCLILLTGISIYQASLLCGVLDNRHYRVENIDNPDKGYSLPEYLYP